MHRRASTSTGGTCWRWAILAEDGATSKERRWWFRTTPHGIWRSCSRLVARVGHAVIHRVQRVVSRRRVCLHGKIGKMLSCTLTYSRSNIHTLLDISWLTYSHSLPCLRPSAEPRSQRDRYHEARQPSPSLDIPQEREHAREIESYRLPRRDDSVVHSLQPAESRIKTT